MSTNKEKLICFLTTPIVPIGFLIYYVCFNVFDIKLISILLTVLGTFISYKFVQCIKQRFEILFQVGMTPKK